MAETAEIAPTSPYAATGKLHRSALGSIRARQLMGWTQGIALADGLAETVDWIRGSAAATGSGVLAAR